MRESRARSLLAFARSSMASQMPKRLKNPVKLFGSQKVSWVERSAIPANAAWIDKWKVLMTRVQGTSAAVETKFLSKPIIAEPGTACTESYLVAGLFDTEAEATNYAKLPSHSIRSLPCVAAQVDARRAEAMSTRLSPTCR